MWGEREAWGPELYVEGHGGFLHVASLERGMRPDLRQSGQRFGIDYQIKIAPCPDGA